MYGPRKRVPPTTSKRMRLRSYLGRNLGRLEHLVGQSVSYRLSPVEEHVTVAVPDDPFEGLAGVLDEDAVDDVAEAQDLFRLNLHVARLAGHPLSEQRLVHVDGRIR